MKNKIKICGIDHQIIQSTDDFNSCSNFGEIIYTKCEIKINKNMPEDLKNNTLIHEIMHGILVHIGYNDLSEDEKFVNALAFAISEIFKLK